MNGKDAVRDAATVVLVRNPGSKPSVLMGQRGKNAVFFPEKFVFPGGALDPGDHNINLLNPLSELCSKRLEADAPAGIGAPLAVAAIRELWEEAGLALGKEGDWPGEVSPDWSTFAARGLCPDADALRFFFRAITPPGRPRRFDARFFIADAASLVGSAEDFSAASDELSHLQWVQLDQADRFPLPFITQVVLAEVRKWVQAGQLGQIPPSVPFFRNDDERSHFLRITGRAGEQTQLS
ncbi:MAG: NUDIX hydrolase [Pseudomonadota bacterium]